MATDLEITNSILTNKNARPPLNDNFYFLNPDELAFFQSQTNISDEDELKAHILAVQARAYEVALYIPIYEITKT